MECLDLHLQDNDNVTFNDDQEAEVVLSGQSKLSRYLHRQREEPWIHQKYHECYELNLFCAHDKAAPKHANGIEALDYSKALEQELKIIRKKVYPRKPSNLFGLCFCC